MPMSFRPPYHIWVPNVPVVYVVASVQPITMFVPAVAELIGWSVLMLGVPYVAGRDQKTIDIVL